LGPDIDPPQILEQQRRGEIADPRLNALLAQINDLQDQIIDLQNQYDLAKTNQRR